MRERETERERKRDTGREKGRQTGREGERDVEARHRCARCAAAARPSALLRLY